MTLAKYRPSFGGLSFLSSKRLEVQKVRVVYSSSLLSGDTVPMQPLFRLMAEKNTSHIFKSYNALRQSSEPSIFKCLSIDRF